MDEKENQILRIMAALKVDRAEAEEIYEADYAIDHNEKLFELEPEKEKYSKSIRKIGRSPAEKPNKKTVKEDPQKKELISILSAAVSDVMDAGSLTIEHPERIFEFKIDEVLYRVVLSTPRK